MKKPSQIRIGISGWTYPSWRGVFYPKGLAHRRELEFASRQMNSLEINGSFYSLKTAKTYQAWFDQTPDDLIFSVKGGRFVTHMKKLKDVRLPLANFFASGVLCLGHKLGPILWQTPENLHYDEARFSQFFTLLPKTVSEAARLAREHDHRVKMPGGLNTNLDQPLRYAFEVRHPSFMKPEFIDLLKHHNMALVIADTAGRWPYMEDVTADFVYIRLHGDVELYKSGYNDASLSKWAKRVRQWANGGEPKDRICIKRSRAPRKKRDVFVYFDNDAKMHAPFDAIALANKLK